MKASEHTTTSNLQTAKENQSQPFFGREGESTFFSGRETGAFANDGSGTTRPFFSPATIQPKLTIGRPGDRYEQEADSMADQVVQRIQTKKIGNTGSTLLAGRNIQRKCAACEAEEQEEAIAPKIQTKSIFESNEETADAQVQRKCTACEAEEIRPKRIQRSGQGATAEASSDLESRLNATKNGGAPLPKETRSSMESAFGADFSNVRVHTDNRSVQMNQELGAQAFTHGSDIYFNSGKYDTQSNGGQHLLAHELTHTIQQGRASGTVQRRGNPAYFPTGTGCELGQEGSTPVGTHVLFRVANSIVSSDDAKKINDFARDWVTAGAKDRVKLYGYASEEGKQKPNWILSCNRATAVKASLNQKGIPNSKIDTIALGETTEFGSSRGPNRRVIMQMISEGPAPRPSGACDSILNQYPKQYLQDQLVQTYLVDEIEDTDDKFLFSKDYRKKLVIQILDDMYRLRADLCFRNMQELVDDVRKRMLNSLNMRSSQGSSQYFKAFGYPNRGSGVAKDCGPRVNKAAREKGYWTDQQNCWTGRKYCFFLTEEGKKNAFDAITLLFTEQSNKCDRTLIHCDYLISMLHFRSFMEALGKEEFNRRVKSGEIKVILFWNGFHELIQQGYTASSEKKNKSLAEVRLSSEDEFIIGDHVLFFNHEAYDDLNENKDLSWRLENAIIIDNLGPGGSKRFQGHGYFKPKSRDSFIQAMLGKFNQLIKLAQGYVNSNNIPKLNEDFAFTLKNGKLFRAVDFDVENGKITNPRIKFHEGAQFSGNWQSSPVKTMALRHLNKDDYPDPFVMPGDSHIEVYRPKESIDEPAPKP